MLFFFFAFVDKSVQAQENGNQFFTLEPTSQQLTLSEENQVLKSQVFFTNNTHTESTFDVTAVEIDQIDENGNIAFSNTPDPQKKPPGYISLKTSTFTLKSGETKPVEFEITNSDSLNPGGHYLSVLVKEHEQGQQTVYPTLSSLVLLRKLNGEVYDLQLLDSSIAKNKLWWTIPATLDLLFANGGNIHVTPRGEIAITDLFHRKVAEGTINESSSLVLPKKQRKISTHIRQIAPSLPMMIYTVHVEGRAQDTNVSFLSEYKVFYCSRFVIGVSVAVTFLLIFLLKIIQRRKTGR